MFNYVWKDIWYFGLWSYDERFLLSGGLHVAVAMDNGQKWSMNLWGLVKEQVLKLDFMDSESWVFSFTMFLCR